jgi:hypothetical protein
MARAIARAILGPKKSCFHGHLNKCPLGDLNKSPWENYLEGGGIEEIIKSTRFCKVHYVLNSDINYSILIQRLVMYRGCIAHKRAFRTPEEFRVS